MAKILIITLSISCALLSQTKPGEASAEYLQFSQDPIGFESGQPVYQKGTIVTLWNKESDSLNIQVNDQVKVVDGETKADLSNILNQELNGTYTVVLETEGSLGHNFGFTIR